MPRKGGRRPAKAAGEWNAKALTSDVTPLGRILGPRPCVTSTRSSRNPWPGQRLGPHLWPPLPCAGQTCGLTNPQRSQGQAKRCASTFGQPMASTFRQPIAWPNVGPPPSAHPWPQPSANPWAGQTLGPTFGQHIVWPRVRRPARGRPKHGRALPAAYRLNSSLIITKPNPENLPRTSETDSKTPASGTLAAKPSRPLPAELQSGRTL